MNGSSVLLIEDNPADVLLIRQAFESQGYTEGPDVVGDGEAAVSRLEACAAGSELTPCLILLDLNLPKISGHEVLRFIKTEPALKRIPVVILTSSSATDDVLACYERYANGYVVKPVTFTELKATVRTLENFWFSTAILPNHVLA